MVNVDDCWMAMDRDGDGKQYGDLDRFPSGMAALGEFMHSKGVRFGIYSDEGTKTCEGYPGSQGYEEIDAQTYASWGVDYLKLDGCYNNIAGYESGYPAMGEALANSGRDIVYSCSWPAYLGSDESAKPFSSFTAAGCDLWRNWDDIDNSWASVVSIIDHWGDYTSALQAGAGPTLGWNDPDMILAGDDHYNPGGAPALSLDQAKVQLSIWSIVAAPLIMSNDLRTVSDEYRALLLNAEMIAVDQDVLGLQGGRIGSQNTTEVWARKLNDGSIAVALLNKDGGDATSDSCSWDVTIGQYPDGGAESNIDCDTYDSLKDIREACCSNADCVTFAASNGASSGGTFGCIKNSLALEDTTASTSYDGWIKTGGVVSGEPHEIEASFQDLIEFTGVPTFTTASVRDIWAKSDLGEYTNSFTATVNATGVVFVLVTPSN
jgi:hypothetical protein